MVIGVTGTPGAGKSTFASELANALQGYTIVEINDIAMRDKLYSEVDEHESKIVMLKELGAAVRREVSRLSGRAIVVGHLLPDIDVKPDVIAVVRADLDVLIARMRQRGYSKEKIHENLISEVVDYCGVNSAERCKETYEIESDSDKLKVINYLSKRSRGESPAPPKKNEIDKLGQLLDLVGTENQYGL